MNIVTQLTELDPNYLYITSPRKILGVELAGHNDAMQLVAGLGASALPALEVLGGGMLDNYLYTSYNKKADAAEALTQQARLLDVLATDQSGPEGIGSFTLLAVDKRAGDVLEKGVKVAEDTERLKRAQTRPDSRYNDDSISKFLGSKTNLRDILDALPEIPMGIGKAYSSKFVPKEQFELKNDFLGLGQRRQDIDRDDYIIESRYEHRWPAPFGLDADSHRRGTLFPQKDIEDTMPWLTGFYTADEHVRDMKWRDPSAEERIVIVPDDLFPNLRLLTHGFQVLAVDTTAREPDTNPDPEDPLDS